MICLFPVCIWSPAIWSPETTAAHYASCLVLGPVVQSIVSLTNTLKYFVEKMRKASHIFSAKNIGIFQILIFEILTKR